MPLLDGWRGQARRSGALGLLLLLSSLDVVARPPDLPTDAPDDAVMATPDEIRQHLRWVTETFGATTPGPEEPAIRVEVRRQDHSVLQFGQSCVDTPLQLGDRVFAHGLGTHAGSEILLHLPPGSSRFHACVGVDLNDVTRPGRGSVQFVVEIEGKEVYRSATAHAGDAPVAVDIDLPEGTRNLTLKTDPTPDGPGWDHGDWADAQVRLGDGRVVWADARPHPFLRRQPPFSFSYGGRRGADLLALWPHQASVQVQGSRIIHTLSWTDPETRLRVQATATAFRRYPAVEWILEFENGGDDDSPVLENVLPLDGEMATGYARRPAVIHHLTGDANDERSFWPREVQLQAGQTYQLKPNGGRPSNGAFPFLNIEYATKGIFIAIGWSGQWQARFDRSPVGPTRVSVGWESARFHLRPGEKVRTPRVLVMPWQGDRLTAHNRWRRLLLFEYVPRQEGRPVPLPVALQCYDRYSGTRTNWSTESMQLEAIDAAKRLGCDTFWLDAAWFPGGFPNGVGNWIPNPQGFPRGLRPLGDACHDRDLRFLVWFEPERVGANTMLAREHPEYVFGGSAGGLFKLQDAGARQWLTETLSAHVRESGIDIYRNDFNMDPLGAWRQQDSPDRRGLTEIRYVEGHYALWDALRTRHPGLRIDNCASGGRRIDIETLSRSVPLWRSDTGCRPGNPDWNQVQTMGLSLYIPLFASCSWTSEAYEVRSAATAGIAAQFDFLNPALDLVAAKRALDEVSETREFWYGDYWPLTRVAATSDVWMAWQLHRPDRDAGVVIAFRRRDCPYPALQAALRGLRAEAEYDLTLSDEGRTIHRSRHRGGDLMAGHEFRLPEKGTSLLCRYQVVGP